MFNRKHIILFVVLLVLSIDLSAQVIETSTGKVELVGLNNKESKVLKEKIISDIKTGTIKMCAADIKTDYNIPEAAVHLCISAEGERYTVVKLLDPVYKDRILRLIPGQSSFEDSKIFDKLLNYISDDYSDLSVVTQKLGKINNRNIDSIAAVYSSFIDTGKFKEICSVIWSLKSENDKSQAYWLLENDGNYKNRIASLLVLSNFIKNDFTLLYFLKSMREKDARVTSTAIEILSSFKDSGIKFNWNYVWKELRYIIDGTNLFAFDSIISLLTKTKVSPELAPKLLKGGGELVIDNLMMQHKEEKEAAYNFLKQISGKDFGYDAGKWKAWIESL